ncbi:MAG: glutathione synthase [Deltaproteobacteria bacterium RBG_16_71_12]|nr:MAG: glutathione synthase [Deltaproteobacteria bacterium RBG_16_71_12]
MRFLTVMDPLPSVNPTTDTTFAILEEAQARGHENLVCGLSALRCEGRRGFARACPATVRRPTAEDRSHAALGAAVDVAFDDVDVIWMRKDPPVEDSYLSACLLLDRHDPARTVVLNDPAGLRVAHEKLWALFADDLGPATLVSSSPRDLVEFVRARGRGVLKPLHLMGGIGVLAFDADDRNLRSAADLLTEDGRRPALAQEYLPEARQGDKRVIVLDGEPVGAVLRVPRDDDVRANLHAGAVAVRAEVDDDDRRICARIGPQLRRLGLYLAGIDVIGGKLTEVNVTSPTGVQQLDRLDGRVGRDRVIARIVDGAEAKAMAVRRE